MTQFKNIPTFEELENNNSSYFADSDYIQSLQSTLNTKHKEFTSKIKVQPLTFIESLINSMSSLYTEKFNRVLKDDSMLNLNSLETACTYNERFLRLHKRSAISLSTDKKGKVVFTALDPTRYFKQGNYTFLSLDDETTVLYIEEEGSLEIYDIKLTLSKAVKQYNTDKEPLEQYSNKDNQSTIVQREKTKDSITRSPVVEITSYNNKKAYQNSLVTLQLAFISDVSWGIYAGSIKLITQMVLMSNKTPAQVEEAIKNLGSTSNVVQVGGTDKLDMFVPGDVKVLLDLFGMYTEILKQIAVQQGADITAIVPSEESGSESAAAKMVKLNYINKARKNFTMIFKQYEEELWDVLKEGFNIDVGFESIAYPDLKVNETEAEKLAYNKELYETNLINFQQLYAATFDMTYEEAGKEITKFKLSPEDLGLDDDEGSEVTE